MGGSFLKEETNRWGGHRKDIGRQECWCLFWLFENWEPRHYVGEAVTPAS